jgi:nucleotide-binding universal stress UspA family protein
MAGLVVIGYDGSRHARHAIELAARPLGAEAAVIVNVWHRGLAGAEVAVPPAVPTAPPLHADADLEHRAQQVADEGAALARDAGLIAETEVRPGASVGDIAAGLIEVAEQRDADFIVVGRRGMSRLRAVVLGSVSEATVRDASRPVVVVPTPDGED